MSTLHFVDTHNMVAFLEKPTESEGFEQIIDFLHANPINYALTVNPTIYTSCIEQFWATVKSKTVNGERQLQALVDKKKVISTETSIRRDLHLEDAEGTDCLPTATIFEELVRMSAKTTSWNEFSSTMASVIICLATNQKFNFSKYIFDKTVKHLEGGLKFLMYLRFVQVFINQQLGDMSHHKKIHVTPSHTKKLFANMKREGKYFSRRVTPLFATMLVPHQEELGEGSDIPIDPQHSPTITQPISAPSTSKPQKKQKSRRKHRKGTEIPSSSSPTEPMTDEAATEEHVPEHSNDPLLSGEDRMKITKLMDLCTKLSERVFDLEQTKTAQAQEITRLKLRIKKLEKKAGSRPPKFKRLYKVGATRRVESSDNACLGDQEDASKQGRSIEDIEKDDEVTLVDETQERNDDFMFDTGDLDGKEVVIAKQSEKVIEEVVNAAQTFSTASVTVTTAGITILVSTVINAATTTKSIPVSTDEIDLAQEITLAQALAAMKSAKPKEKDVVQEPSKHVSTATTMVSTDTTTVESKDKGKAIMIEPEVPLKMKDQEKVESQEQANIALIEEWDNVQAMMEADYELCQILQAQEQGELTIKERSRLFVELMNERKRHFARLSAEEHRRKPLTKGQKRNQMCTYLKNMGGFTHNQLKNKSFEEIQKAFNKTMSWINSFVPMDSEVAKGSEDKAEGSEKKAKGNRKKAIGRKRAESSKRQRVEDNKEIEELKQCFEIVIDKEVAIDLEFDREDLENLWRLVKAKHMDVRPEEGFEKVLWGDLKVMFEPDVESEVWRNLQGHKVSVWKLFDTCGVHFVRFQNLHIYMLVEKGYPLTPATLTAMLNKKLQADHWNAMCYQLLKLITKQLKNPGSGRIVGIKRLLEVATAQYNVSTVSDLIEIYAKYTAGTKVNAAGLQLLEEFLLSEG
ncbi:hypothetical protein Tco_0425960 [Tanacetum coccineum]